MCYLILDYGSNPNFSLAKATLNSSNVNKPNSYTIVYLLNSEDVDKVPMKIDEYGTRYNNSVYTIKIYE
jgi:hypothetical protein